MEPPQTMVAGSGNITIVQYGDGNTASISAAARIELFLPEQRVSKNAKGDLALLNPNRTAIPLIGRGEDIKELLAWAKSERRVLIRCVTGQGGAGKTRIAVELVNRLHGG